MTGVRHAAVAGLALCLGATALFGDTRRHNADRPPAPHTRRVAVTDLHCGADGPRSGDHRRCALQCSSEGSPLVLFDARRDALYTIVYGSPELQHKVLNDFAGLEGLARGVWDDEKMTVQLQEMFETGPEESLRDRPVLDGRGVGN